VSSTVGLLDLRTVTGCGLRVLGLWEASASGVLRICVRITYLLRTCVRIFGAPAGRHLLASSTSRNIQMNECGKLLITPILREQSEIV